MLVLFLFMRACSECVYTCSCEGGLRDGERETGWGVSTKQQLPVHLLKVWEQLLLFQGRVVSDCDPPFFLLSLSFPPLLSLSLVSSTPPPCLLPPISSPQREKRWSISSAGGEKNSSSVSRGVSGRERERDEMGGFGARRQGRDGEREWIDTQ